MAEYIDRTVLLNHLKDCKGQPPEMCYTFAVLTAIESFVKSQLAADVVEVIHAKWNVILSCDEWQIKCSNCGRVLDRFVNGAILPEYCFCGAKMDLEESK